MSVQTTTRRNVYLGNGSTRVFPITFPFSDAADIFCFVADETGISVATSDFEVQGNSVVYPKNAAVPLPAGHKLTIVRTVDLVQQLNLVDQGPFLAEDIERALDILTFMVQQLADDVRRCIILDVSEEGLSGSLVLPKAPLKSFRWNAAGDGLELTDDPASVLPQVQAVLADTEAARDDLLLRPGYLAVEGNITKVEFLADNMGTVAGVYAIRQDMTDVLALAPHILNCTEHMEEIIRAVDFAAEAKRWAIGEPTEPEGGSAKYWAHQSHADQLQADWDETDAARVTYIKNKPVVRDVIPSGYVPGNKDIVSAKFIVDHLEEFTFVLDDDTEIKKKFLVVDYTAPADTGD